MSTYKPTKNIKRCIAVLMLGFVLLCVYSLLSGYFWTLKITHDRLLRACLCAKSNEMHRIINSSLFESYSFRYFSANGQTLSLNGVTFDLTTGEPNSEYVKNMAVSLPKDVVKSFGISESQSKIALTPDGKHFVCVQRKDAAHNITRDLWAHVYHIESGKEVLKRKLFSNIISPFITGLAIDNELSSLILISSNAYFHRYDIKKQIFQESNNGFWYRFDAIEFSPDCQHYLTYIIGEDNIPASLRSKFPEYPQIVPVVAILWNSQTHQEEAYILIVPNSDEWAVVTPDGKFDGTDQLLNILILKSNGLETKKENFTPLNKLPAHNRVQGLLATFFE